MATLDLKPLTQETIDQMNFQKHDLWLVKINDELFGPFETESLKHYASENQEQFDNASATRTDVIDYQPFWTHALFQRRQLQPVADKHDGPYWLMDNGLKIGPLSFTDVDKKIELGLLVMTDHISIDDGDNWIRICEIERFDRRAHTADELPAVPTEDIFHKGKLSLVEKMENSHSTTTTDQLAELAHVGTQEAKVIQFKAEEIAHQVQSQNEISASLKWAVPAAMAVVVALVSTGYVMFSSSDEVTPVITESETKEQPFYQKPKPTINRRAKHSPRGSIPSVERMPASTSYAQESIREDYQESRYPTHIETHRPYEETVVEHREEQPATPENGEENRAPAAAGEEHSLVAGNNNAAPEETSLDAAMNGTEQPAEQQAEKPVIEEASDF